MAAIITVSFLKDKEISAKKVKKFPSNHKLVGSKVWTSTQDQLTSKHTKLYEGFY